MEHKRAQTLEALEAFIQTQRTLLARTQSDITQLEKLRSDATARPAAFMSNLEQELNETTLHLSNLSDAQLVLPHNIDWSLYDAHDPKAMQTLALDARRAYEQRNTPCTYQRSELSALQKLVKDARRTIVDPVLAVFECVSDLEPEPEDERRRDPAEERREREREKLRELKKRKIRGHEQAQAQAHVRRWGGLGLPAGYGRGVAGVFIRRDVEDESGEVVVTLDAEVDAGDEAPMDVDGPGVVSSSLGQVLPSAPKVPRNRAPSYKSRLQSPPQVRRDTKKKTNSATRKSKAAPLLEHDDDAVPAPQPKPRAEKPRPETYKQAWSVSEQHLLEQLLEEIPEGEKNRWQKISRAMNGRRTPRQVASRVQKYFEKLKRFGLGEG